jgi:hypothetical protein
MDVVVIPLLFYYHEKGVIDADTTTTTLYLHQPHFSARFTKLGRLYMLMWLLESGSKR